jgi:hypothetical protein
MMGAFLVAASFSGFACLPGPELLAEDANVDLIVAGVRAPDALALFADGAVYRASGRSEGIVLFHLALPAGQHEVTLVITGRGAELCAGAIVDAPPAGRVTAALDAAAAVPCDLVPADPVDAGPQDAADQLVHLQEIAVQVPCAGASCASVTSVTGDGLIVFQRDESERIARLATEDLAAFVVAALDDDVDALFRAGAPCAVPGAPPGESVSLERVVLVAGQEREVARIDATGCSGSAAELRARLALLRAISFGE